MNILIHNKTYANVLTGEDKSEIRYLVMVLCFHKNYYYYDCDGLS